MGLEIERKFLVHKDLWQELRSGSAEQLQQAYLTHEDGRSVRIRLTDSEAYLTIKGKREGISRAEYEYAIPRIDAQEMIRHFNLESIIKTRTTVIYKEKLWEVDEFHGDNSGLIIAEIELKSEDEHFELPPWVSTEVSDQEQYSNSRLLLFPYKSWLHSNM